MSNRNKVRAWLDREKPLSVSLSTSEGDDAFFKRFEVEHADILPSVEEISKQRLFSERFEQFVNGDENAITEEEAEEILGVFTSPTVDDPMFF